LHSLAMGLMDSKKGEGMFGVGKGSGRWASESQKKEECSSAHLNLRRSRPDVRGRGKIDL